MRIRFLTIGDGDETIGGVKQIYRQVDVLNASGYDAAVVHQSSNFRCSWFENQTVVMGRDDLVLDDCDYVVIPEVFKDIPKFKFEAQFNTVVYIQGPFLALHGFGGLENLFEFYRTKVKAAMCVSEHSLKHLSAILPTKIYRVRHSFDRAPFGMKYGKERLIAYMPRRRRTEIEYVLTMLDCLKALRGWRVEVIDDKTEKQVADILRRATVFMAGGYLEGFGMSAAEAMACGCVVVGWDGHGGREIFKPEFSYPIPDGDVLAYVETMRRVLGENTDELDAKGRAASEFITREYSAKKEAESILTAWQEIITG